MRNKARRLLHWLRITRYALRSAPSALDSPPGHGNHRAMKIYTRTGDDGTTGLFGGGRVRKCDARLECYGTVDELNAVIGLAEVAAPADVKGKLRQIQNELFVIGAHLATPEASKADALPALDDS